MLVIQQLQGRLRTMGEMFDHDAVATGVVDTLKLEEHSQVFQTLLNQELMGMEAGTGSRSRETIPSPPEPRKTKQGMKPTRPPLQGAYPCYS